MIRLKYRCKHRAVSINDYESVLVSCFQLFFERLSDKVRITSIGKDGNRFNWFEDGR